MLHSIVKLNHPRALAAILVVGLMLLVGCDRLGIGRTNKVAVDPTPVPTDPIVETTEPESLPPAREPMASGDEGAVAARTPSGVDGAGGPAEGGSEDGFEPPIGPDELDKPIEPPPEAKGLLRLPDPQEKGAMQDLWVDKENKRVIVGGRICKRKGDMELFACLRRTKEHESIVSVRARAFAVHATLVAIGVKPGRAVRFVPEFSAAEGPEIEVTVAWTDDKGKRQTVRAQEWLRHMRTKKAMEQAWIFAGSGFWTDNEGQSHYMADDGDFICVSNFASAMLDVPIHAPNANAALLFEAFHERIPPLGTPVALILSAKAREPLEAPSPK
jgi:hypothetical protein